jgi:hypothetical protein
MGEAHDEDDDDDDDDDVELGSWPGTTGACSRFVTPVHAIRPSDAQ